MTPATPHGGTQIIGTAAHRLAAPVAAADIDTLQTAILGPDEELQIHGFETSRHVTKVVQAHIMGALAAPIELDLSMKVASTILAKVKDRDRTLLRHPMLIDPVKGGVAPNVNAYVRGMWFELAHVARTAGGITELTFEDQVIAVIRRDKHPKKVVAGAMTFPEFARYIVTAGGKRRYKFVSPDLGRFTGQTGTGTADQSRTAGFPAGVSFTVKGVKADKQQVKNIAAVLDTGLKVLTDTGSNVRKILVAAVMTVIQESTARNLQGGDADSVGMFQQRGSQGWPASRVIEQDATAFYQHAIAEDRLHPNEQLWTLCANVQRPREDLRNAYAAWQDEAWDIVGKYLGGGRVVPTDIATKASKANKYSFHQGGPDNPGEDGWECIQRYATDLGYHVWSDVRTRTVYCIDTDDLLASRARLTISEDLDAVDDIAFDCDAGKQVQTATVTCESGLWTAPPGSVAIVEHHGPADGRWLVADYRRKLTTVKAEVDLERPNPALGEIDKNAPIATLAPIVIGQSPAAKAAADAKRNPSATTDIGPASELAARVLQHRNIDLTTYAKSNRDDIVNGLIKDTVLRGMLVLADAGWEMMVTALKTNHGDDGPNGHAGGKAVDIGKIGVHITNADDPRTVNFMEWCNDNQKVVGWRQMFGPIGSLNFVTPSQKYGKVYPGHDNHVHLGW